MVKFRFPKPTFQVRVLVDPQYCNAGKILRFHSESTAWLASGLERRSHVALRQTSRGREYLVDFKRSEENT